MLAIETGRHRKVAEQERICLICHTRGLLFREKEFHFLLGLFISLISLGYELGLNLLETYFRPIIIHFVKNNFLK